MTISGQSREQLLRYQDSLDCIHCGLCLPKCPTYVETGNEVASPRGRIYLMRGLAEGRVEPTRNFAEQMELCLVCRACESICPSGVEFSRMMEITRHELHSSSPDRFHWRIFRRVMLNHIIPSRRLLGFVASLARFYTTSGVLWFARTLRLTYLVPALVRTMIDVLPDVPPRAERRPLPSSVPANADVPHRGRVAFLSGCVMEQLFGAINHRAVDVLAREGWDVIVPQGQTCCGALHAHAGDMDTARNLARQNVTAFLDADVDWIVLDSAGCGAAMVDYARWLEADDAAEAARKMSGKVVDIMALFAKEGCAPRGKEELAGRRVTYDAPCHLHHAQRCVTPPLDVLKRVPDIELVPMAGAEDCCGAAGIYNLTHPKMSSAILETKLDQLAASGAEILVTGNPGCILQWRRGIADRGLDVQVMHPVELL